MTAPRSRHTDSRRQQGHLLAEIRPIPERVIAERVAGLTRGDENQELVVGHVDAEVVAVAGFEARATGAVEFRAGVDARGGYVAAVKAGDGVAGSACAWVWVGIWVGVWVGIGIRVSSWAAIPTISA